MDKLTENIKSKRLKQIIAFIKLFMEETAEKELFTHANELTYKLLLSFFPFVIFLMSLVGFLDIGADLELMARDLAAYVPEQGLTVVEAFSQEVLANKHPGVLSGSLVMALYTASGGCIALNRGISKAYGETKKRGFIAERLISVALVLVLAAVIIGSVFLLVCGDALFAALTKEFPYAAWIDVVFGGLGYLTLFFALLTAIILIYKVATVKAVKIYEAFPGAVVTLFVWIVSSRLFSVYVSNFAQYSVVYGSIAGVVILMFWINMVSAALLAGAEINGLIERSKDKTLGALPPIPPPKGSPFGNPS